MKRRVLPECLLLAMTLWPATSVLRAQTPVNTGAVVMTHDVAGNWVVYTPAGASLPVFSSATQGLQEAVNYALQNQFDLTVLGGGGGGASVINLMTTLSFPPMQNHKIRINGVTLNCTGAVGPQPCVMFDSMMMMDVDFGATQIVNAGTGPTVLYRPMGRLPVDGSTVITDSSVHITTIVNIHNPQFEVAGVPLVDHQLTAGSIVETTFLYDELNGAGGAFRIPDPASTSFGFVKNNVTAAHIHDQTGVSVPVVALGTTSVYPFSILHNRFDLRIDTRVAGKRSIDVFTRSNWFFLGVEAINVYPGNAIYFEWSADFNEVYAVEFDGGIGGMPAHNILHTNQISKFTYPVNVGGSPFVYQNNDFRAEDVTINGGAVGSIAISADGITFSDTGLTSGLVHLEPGMYLSVTYSMPPAMRKIL